jgi:class 3 adenylate cyclase
MFGRRFAGSRLKSACAPLPCDATSLAAARRLVRRRETADNPAMSRRAQGRNLAALLFTDIVGSTEIAVELGDRRWRAIQAEHHSLIRRELRRFGGREIDTAGDSFFATFHIPQDAVRSAAAIVDATRSIGIEVRAGLHFGETELSSGGAGGIAVHTAARVSSLAAPGEVLVTQTIVDLVSGSGLDFDERGTHELKGVGRVAPLRAPRGGRGCSRTTARPA